MRFAEKNKSIISKAIQRRPKQAQQVYQMTSQGILLYYLYLNIAGKCILYDNTVLFSANYYFLSSCQLNTIS